MSDRGAMDDWRSIDVENEFTLDVPPAASWKVEGDGATFVLRLPTTPFTEILISRHAQQSTSEGRAFLEGRVHRFLQEHAAKASGGDLGVSIKIWAEPIGVDVVQGVATDGDGDWWLVRAYDAGHDYFWIQWTGPEEPLNGDVLRVFESFVPAQRWRPKWVVPQA